MIFIVAYDAEKTILGVLERIPKTLSADYDVEILIIDDCSLDATAEITQRRVDQHGHIFPITLLRNLINQGYGGTQKIGYRYAILHGFDVVVLLHGDGQYAPEKISELLLPFRRNAALGAVATTPGSFDRLLSASNFLSAL